MKGRLLTWLAYVLLAPAFVLYELAVLPYRIFFWIGKRIKK